MFQGKFFHLDAVSHILSGVDPRTAPEGYNILEAVSHQTVFSVDTAYNFTSPE